MADYMVWIWLAVFVICLILEIFTTDLVSIWFSLSAFICLILAAFNVDYMAQVYVFAGATLFLEVITRPLCKKYMRKDTYNTNIDAIISRRGVATKDFIDGELGEIKIDGKYWSSISDDKIVKDNIVEVIAVDGVKLIVKRLEK